MNRFSDLFARWFVEDPEIAMTWAEAIVNEERKERTVTEVKKVAERIAQTEGGSSKWGASAKYKPERGWWRVQEAVLQVLLLNKFISSLMFFGNNLASRDIIY